MESETLKEHLPLASHLNSVLMTFSARHSVTEVCRYSDCWAASNSDLSVTFDGKVRTGAQAECAAVQFARFRENCLCRTITPPHPRSSLLPPLMLTVCQDYVDALQGIDLGVGVIASNSDLDDDNTNNRDFLYPDAERSRVATSIVRRSFYCE